MKYSSVVSDESGAKPSFVQVILADDYSDTRRCRIEQERIITEA